MKRVALGMALAAAAPAIAEVKSVEANGFAVRSVATIAAAPDRVWEALIKPGRWWNLEHSYSRDGANLTLDPVAGGCFCEKLTKAKGTVEHMRVVMVMPDSLLRLRGGLGPLQGMGVEGALTWELKAIGKGTEISQTYAVGGHIAGGGQGLAPIVDGVMSDQLAHLKAYVEKARP